jgi:hypothetical protein
MLSPFSLNLSQRQMTGVDKIQSQIYRNRKSKVTRVVVNKDNYDSRSVWDQHLNQQILNQKQF